MIRRTDRHDNIEYKVGKHDKRIPPAIVKRNI